MSSATARQVIAAFLDGTVQNLLYLLLIKAVDANHAAYFERWKAEIRFLIDVLYSILSLEVEWLGSLFREEFGGVTGGITGSVGMTVLGQTWGEKGSTGIYALLLVLQFALTKLRQLSIVGNWHNDSNWTLRWSHEIVRVCLSAFKILSIASFVRFVAWRDRYPTLLHRLSGYAMQSVTDGPAYRRAQLFMEQRKFMWLAMTGLASAAVISVDWQEVRLRLRHAAQSLSSFLKRSTHVLQTTGDQSDLEGDRQDMSNTTLTWEDMSCAVCRRCPAENPSVNPRCKGAHHIFCYLCLATQLTRRASQRQTRSTSSREGEEVETVEESDEDREYKRCPQCQAILLSAEPFVIKIDEKIVEEEEEEEEEEESGNK